jgi:hypothetical protein
MKIELVSVVDSMRAASLSIVGSALWNDPTTAEKLSGVYVVTAAEPSLDGLSPKLRNRWNEGQEIVYVGRSKNVRRRIREFFKHKHGERRPHAGGQDILLLRGTLTIHWTYHQSCWVKEHELLTAFVEKVGRPPFANRARSARMTTQTSQLI